MVQICSTLGKVRDRSKEGRQSGLNWPPHRIETAAPVWATVCKGLQGLCIFAGANIGLCSFCHLKGATFFIPPSNIEGGAALRMQKCSLQLIKGGKCKILSIKGQLSLDPDSKSFIAWVFFTHSNVDSLFLTIDWDQAEKVNIIRGTDPSI